MKNKKQSADRPTLPQDVAAIADYLKNRKVAIADAIPAEVINSFDDLIDGINANMVGIKAVAEAMRAVDSDHESIMTRVEIGTFLQDVAERTIQACENLSDVRRKIDAVRMGVLAETAGVR